MEAKIKNQNELIEADWIIEVVAKVVSPKEVRVDVSQFKDGDVITCGWDETKKSYRWTCILRGDIECISDTMFISDYCSLDCIGDFIGHNDSSDSATWVRNATEEEKQKLFKALENEGYEWDVEKKQLVKLKWKPKFAEDYYTPSFDEAEFVPCLYGWTEDETDLKLYEMGWVFKTKQECQAFCNRLNKELEKIKP